VYEYKYFYMIYYNHWIVMK